MGPPDIDSDVEGDWQGWGERRVVPAIPASSQDVDTDSDDDIDVGADGAID